MNAPLNTEPARFPEPQHPDLQAQLYRYAEDLYQLMSEHDQLQQRFRELDRSYRSVNEYRDLLTTLMYSASEGYLTTNMGIISNSTRTAHLMLASDELVGLCLRDFVADESKPVFDELAGHEKVLPSTCQMIQFINAKGDSLQALVRVVGSYSVKADKDQCCWSISPLPDKQKISHEYAVSRQEHGSEAVFFTDNAGTLKVVNDAFCRITGYSADECLGQPIRLLKSGVQDESFYRLFWEAIRENGGWHGEIVNRRKNGDLYPEWLSVNSSCGVGGEVVGYFGIFHDLSRLHESERHLSKLAYYDVLTGLPNRHLFQDRLKMALGHAKRSQTSMALMFIDLDRFKQVNDTLGHDVGDELLKAVAKRLSSATRDIDTVARLGGDEFTVILQNLASEHDVRSVAEKILDAFQPPIQIGSHLLFPAPSIGITLYPQHGKDEGTLIRRADTAMYRAKSDGGNTYRVFEPEDDGDSQALSLEGAFRQALARGELYLVYQPQMSSDGTELHGIEALLRWESEDFGTISPDVFIPIAEKSGAIIEIGRWVIRNACTQLAQWQSEGLAIERVAVNISPRQLRDANFTSLLLLELESSGLPASALELEITESELMLYPESTMMKLEDLRRQGISIAIDDFGTGYSNLARLRSLPVDRIKVDRSFVKDLEHDSDAQAISTCIVTMARVMKLDVIAEGVETTGQLEQLLGQGCTSIQGFLFAQPMLPSAMDQWMNVRKLNDGRANVA